jgi:hypothetical protein
MAAQPLARVEIRASFESFQDTKTRPVIPHRKRVFVLGLAADFDLFELLQSGFHLGKIKPANAANFDHWNNAGAGPVAETAAGDVELFGALLRGEKVSAVGCALRLRGWRYCSHVPSLADLMHAVTPTVLSTFWHFFA